MIEGYDDPTVTSVWEKKTYDGYRCVSIHIQVVHDVGLKNSIQLILRATGLLSKRRDKMMARQIWKAAWMLYQRVYALPEDLQ